MGHATEITHNNYQLVWKVGDKSPSPLVLTSCDGDVLLCKSWPSRTESLCHNCCHAFATVPVPLPQTYDHVRRIYYCRGLFCSWNCAKSYNLSNTTVIGRGDRNAYISLLAYRLWVRYNKCGAFDGKRSSALDRYSRHNIQPSPPKECLKAFGGDVAIEDYRKHFFGIVPPEEAVVGKPFLNIREAVAKETMVLPFVNLSGRPAPPASVVTKQPSRALDSRKNPFLPSTGSSEGVHRNANEFCTRLNRATDSQATMLKRKRNSVAKNTLMSSMGIVVEKRKK